MHTKLAFFLLLFLKPPVKKGGKRKEVKQQHLSRGDPGPAALRLAGGTPVEGIGSYSGLLLPSAAIPGKQLPASPFTGKPEGLGEKTSAWEGAFTLH